MWARTNRRPIGEAVPAAVEGQLLEALPKEAYDEATARDIPLDTPVDLGDPISNQIDEELWAAAGAAPKP